MYIRPDIRNDKQGQGHFGAPRKNSRGSYEHQGIDFCAPFECPIYSHVDGVVTKIGRPYYYGTPKNKKERLKNELRYVQVTDDNEIKHRFFYVEPSVSIGDVIPKGGCIGIAQNLEKIYKGMDNHIHLECKDKHNNILDPNEYL